MLTGTLQDIQKQRLLRNRIVYHITTMRSMTEEYLTINRKFKYTCATFIDMKKVYGQVDWKGLSDVLKVLYLYMM